MLGWVLLPNPGIDDHRLRRFCCLETGVATSTGEVGAESAVDVVWVLLVFADEPVVLGEL